MALHLGCLLALLPTLAAQTFVVDASNGPGANFTNLQTAVSAVPDGAILLVRPGVYAGFTMTGKGLTVLGDLGVDLTAPIVIANTAPHQSVTLRQLTWPAGPFPGGSTRLELAVCAGPVLLEGIVQAPSPVIFLPCQVGQCDAVLGIYALSCEQLYLRNCDVRCTVRLDVCNAVIESCFLEGEDSGAVYWTMNQHPSPARTALNLFGTNAQICGNTTIQGGAGYGCGLCGYYPAGSGIRLQNIGIYAGSLRALDGQIRAGLAFTTTHAAISVGGPAQVRVGTRAIQTSSAGPPTPGTDTMPTLLGTSTASGGALMATAVTENGDLVILAVGLPGPPLTLPGLQDPFWLDPALHVFAAIGVQTATTPITATVPVPPGPTYLGLQLNWQAAVQGPVTGFQASNPVVTLVH